VLDNTGFNRILVTVNRFVLRYRRPIAVAVHLSLAWGANVIAFLVRFDGQVPPNSWAAQTAMLPWLLVMRACGFMAFGQFRGLWRYASLYDLRVIVLAVFSSSAGFFTLVRWVFAQPDYPRSIYLIDGMALIGLLGGLRMARRSFHEMRSSTRGRSVLVVGAGDAGELIVRDMLHNPDYDYQPIGFVDDAPAKQGERIHGVPVLGKRADLARVIERTQPDDVLIAMPSAPRAVIQDVVRALQPFHVNIITLPSLREIVSGHVAIEQIRKLAIEDLLTRPAVGLDPAPVRNLIAGRRVMVTGAGGSIGSELCRQIAALQPQTLLLFERYENSLFAIANELQDRWPALDIRPLVGDICDAGRLAGVFSRVTPHIIFHAAAHKHVPLMELSPCEAVKNNVFGTQQLADVAAQFGVERFTLISTDKAVNPTSTMGVSKRVAEMIVQSKNGSSGTTFAAVRFGNVLGSNGSVVPRFLDQIKAGGPVTVTHPEMRRYFMLIPEAVQLVMHASAMAKGGEVFVLDMGEQMKVLDMARTLIRLSGFVPDQDIPITFIGLRPGEKLYEELVGSQESVEPSGVEKITKIRRDEPVDTVSLHAHLTELRQCSAEGSLEDLQRALRKLVPSYQPDSNAVGTCDGPGVGAPTRAGDSRGWLP
jgi:FlaA1/EpsC-like NDP-sugar epimerase